MVSRNQKAIQRIYPLYIEKLRKIYKSISFIPSPSEKMRDQMYIGVKAVYIDNTPVIWRNRDGKYSDILSISDVNTASDVPYLFENLLCGTFNVSATSLTADAVNRKYAKSL